MNVKTWSIIIIIIVEYIYIYIIHAKSSLYIYLKLGNIKGHILIGGVRFGSKAENAHVITRRWVAGASLAGQCGDEWCDVTRKRRCVLGCNPGVYMLKDVVAGRVVAVVEVAVYVSTAVNFYTQKTEKTVQGGGIDNLCVYDTRGITNGLRGIAVMSKPHHDFILGDRAVSGIFFGAVEKHIDGNVGVECDGIKLRSVGSIFGCIAQGVCPRQVNIQ